MSTRTGKQWKRNSAIFGMSCGLATLLAPFAHASMETTWKSDPAIAISQATQDYSTDLDADAERVFIRADQGQVSIQDLEVDADDGSSWTLKDLLQDSGNRTRYGKGIIDHTGAPAYPRSITLYLESRVHLTSISVRFNKTVGGNSAVFMSVLATDNSGTTPQPQPQPPQPDPQPQPTQVPQPQPTSVPPVACDMGQLNQQIGMCMANQQNNQNQITQLFAQENLLKGQLQGMGDYSGQLAACTQDSDRITAQIQDVESRALQARQDRESFEHEAKSNNQNIEWLKHPKPKSWKCWLVERHGQRYEVTGQGNQLDVLKPLLFDLTKTGEGNIGKQNWRQDGNWGCDPL